MKNKVLLMVILSLLAVCSLCGSAFAQESEAETGAVIDLGESKLYTTDELESAVEVILAEFDTWEGCEMHILSYAGDEESIDSLDDDNRLERGVFDEAVMFDSAFRSPKEQYGAWEADTEYTWSWSLARADKGEWQLVNWGWKENWFKSEQYTRDELEAGAQVIYSEFEKMEGTRVHYMKYAGDEFSSSELEYVNSLERGVFDECAVYYVWFQSPKNVEMTAWEPDMLYNWSFYLARADKGEWQLLTYGN